MTRDTTKHIIIGGSAGSFQSVIKILESLPKNYPHSIMLVLHRLKHVRKGFVEALRIKTKVPVSEPMDKEIIENSHVYLAPANYHVYFDLNNTFMLSAEETVNHSRPSIDVSFSSAAQLWKKRLTGIILSGANSDGAKGLSDIESCGGTVIIQDPDEAQVRTMPEKALAQTRRSQIMKLDEIINYILHL